MALCPYCDVFTPSSRCDVPRCGGFICGTCNQCNRQERFHPPAGQEEDSPAMPASAVARTTTTMLATAALLAIAAGCASGHVAVADHKAQAAPVLLSTLRACQRLRADVVANGGTPDRPTLAYLVDHAASQRVAFLASHAEQDVGDANLPFSPGLVLLESLCARQGVQIAG
jgi:hypothetical protein